MKRFEARGDEIQRRILFATAAGPRLGFGHLVRCLVLADALRLSPTLALRGTRAAREVATARGASVLTGQPAWILAESRPAALVVDDPCPTVADRWCRVARHRGIPVASVHDLGIGVCESDLVIDGSVTGNDRLRGQDALIGPRFAILNPALSRLRRTATSAAAGAGGRVLVALGGGPRTAQAARLAGALLRRRPTLEIRIAGGFMARQPTPVAGITWLPGLTDLAGELSGCTVAITGGGVTLYEAVCLGVPTVAVATVSSQRPTIRAFARRRAIVDAGTLAGSQPSAGRRGRPGDRIADRVIGLLDDPEARRGLSRAGRSLVDGRGAARVAGALRRLAQGRSTALM